MDAPWYVLNTVIQRDLQISRVKEEICRYSFLQIPSIIVVFVILMFKV
jgi:hypothetical protein